MKWLQPSERVTAFYLKYDALMFMLNIIAGVIWGTGIHEIVWGPDYSLGWAELALGTALLVPGPIIYFTVIVRDILRRQAVLKELKRRENDE